MVTPRKYDFQFDYPNSSSLSPNKLGLSQKSFFASLSLSITSARVGLALVVLFMIVRCPSEIPIRRLWKNIGVLLTGPVNYTAHMGPHSEVTGRETEGECTWAWGSAFTGWGPRVLWTYSLLVNVSHKSGNLNMEREKTVAQMVTYLDQPRSLKQRGLPGRRWLCS